MFINLKTDTGFAFFANLDTTCVWIIPMTQRYK